MLLGTETREKYFYQYSGACYTQYLGSFTMTSHDFPEAYALYFTSSLFVLLN